MSKGSSYFRGYQFDNSHFISFRVSIVFNNFLLPTIISLSMRDMIRDTSNFVNSFFVIPQTLLKYSCEYYLS